MDLGTVGIPTQVLTKQYPFKVEFKSKLVLTNKFPLEFISELVLTNQFPFKVEFRGKQNVSRGN